MTEWVTIKIPEETRDAAKSDPRTYQQIMEAGLENEPFGSPECYLPLSDDGPFEDFESMLATIEERVEQIPERTADEVEARFR